MHEIQSLTDKKLQLLADNIEVFTRAQFWKMNPAPGTIFIEVGTMASQVVGSHIDVHTTEPDDILAVKVGNVELDVEDEIILVLKWGSWVEHQELLEMHDEAAKIMDTNAGENAKYRHDDCILDRTW